MGVHWMRVAGHRAALVNRLLLGEPDHGCRVELPGSLMMAGAFLAIAARVRSDEESNYRVHCYGKCVPAVCPCRIPCATFSMGGLPSGF